MQLSIQDQRHIEEGAYMIVMVQNVIILVNETLSDYQSK